LSLRILVVDDDGLVLTSVAKVLSRAGYDVLTAADGESALRHAESGPIDGAIVDYTLSRETGLGILQRLLEIHPMCVRILITGRTDTYVYEEAINEGEVDRVVRKPFAPPDLLQQLDEAFQRRERSDLRVSGARTEEERNQLAEVVRREQLGLALQRIVDVSKGEPRTVAWEALLRPRHHRLDSPSKLFDLAERHHRVLEVGSHVLGLALATLAELPDRGLLFVNLHPHQLGHPDRLARDLEPFGKRARRVALELTERSSLQDIDRWEESVRIIQERGFALAVDDLGAGYSSLSILADIQPQYIKLDMSLVRRVQENRGMQRLVSLMRQFGDATDATVIAEGVESAEESRALVECGIDWMQGYLYGRPDEDLSRTRSPAPVRASGRRRPRGASARTTSTSEA